MVRVTKNYGPVRGLNGLSFRTEERGIVGLLGQNGAGKSTTLNLATGYFPPNSGRVLVDGRDLAKEPRACKRNIGYLPEKPPLYDEMTVREYLCFVSSLKEVASGQITGHVEEIMGLCGLDEVADRLIGQLSKGYRQRAGLAQTLCGNPKNLILDEPTVGLDPKQVVEIRELIRRLGKDHLILFSTHLLAEAQQLCDHVLILNRGNLVRFMDMTQDEERGCMHLRLTVAGDKENVIRGLKSLEGIRKVRMHAGVKEGVLDGELVFDEAAGGEDPRKRLFRLLCALDAPILRLTREKNSLEEIFLKATAEEKYDDDAPAEGGTAKETERGV